MRTEGNTTRAAIRNVVILLPYHGLDSLLVFAYTIFIARGLGVDGFGLFVTGVSLGATAFLLLDAGLSIATTRNVAGRTSSPIVLRTALLARGAITTALAAAGAIALMWRVDNTTAVLCGLAAAEGLRSVQQLGQSILLGSQAAGRVALTNALEKSGILLSVGAIAWLQGGLTPGAVALAYGVGRVPAALHATWSTRTQWRGSGVSLTAMARSTQASWNVGAFILSERLLAYILPLILTMVAGLQATALFQSAFKMILLPVSFFTALSSALYPALARLRFESADRGHHVLDMTMRVSITFALGWVVYFILCGEDLLLLVFGAPFVSAASLLLLLLPYLVLSAIWQMSLYALTAQGEERIARDSSVASTLTAIVLVVVLSPALGAAAAPVAMAASFTAAVTLCLRRAHFLRGGLVGGPAWVGAAVLVLVAAGAGALLLRLSAPSSSARVLLASLFLAVAFPVGAFLFGALPRSLLRHAWMWLRQQAAPT